VDQEAEHNTLDFFLDLQERQEQSKETYKSQNLGDLGVGRESFTVQNVHESVLSVGLSV
jgi:hypothetical protein